MVSELPLAEPTLWIFNSLAASELQKTLAKFQSSL